MLGKIILCKDAKTHDSDVLIANPVLVQMIPFIPATPSFRLVGCIAIEDARRSSYDILVVLKDANEKVVSSFEGQLVNPESSNEINEWKTNIVFNLSLEDIQVHSEGLHAFELYVDEELVDITNFLVKVDPQTPPKVEVK